MVAARTQSITHNMKFIKSKFTRDLANEAGETSDVQELTLPNESPIMSASENWHLIAPYGDHGHADGMQRITREDAVAMVNEFNSPLNLVARVVGLPWYIGHPDHPAFKDRYKDTRAYGRIKRLKAGKDGLLANVSWNNAGKGLIEERAFHGHSPNWSARKDGTGRWRPVKLKSVGFTNENNLPVPPVLVANEKQPKGKKQMPQWLKEILLAGGFIKPGASDEQTQAGAQAMANEVTTLRTRLTELEGERDTLANEQSEAKENKTRLGELETSLANERKGRAELVVDTAITAGQVIQGDRDARVKTLCDAEDFDAAAKALANEQVKLKTKSKVADAGKRSNKDLSHAQERRQFVNETMEKQGVSYDTAWASAKKDAPHLFNDGDE